MERGPQRRSLYTFVAALTANAPEQALCGQEWCNEPRIAPPTRDAPDLDSALRLLHLGERPARATRGQPARTAPEKLPIAAQVALRLDLEGESHASELEHLSRALGFHRRPDGDLRARRSLSPVSPVMPDDDGSSGRTPTSRSKTLLRWRAGGRAARAALGAWPWALTEDGILPAGRWWRREPYVIALASWAEEHEIGVPDHWQRWAVASGPAPSARSAPSQARQPSGEQTALRARLTF